MSKAVAGAFSRASLGNNPKLGSWLRFNDDHTVTLYTGKVDIGQGISTALVQIAAEELDVNPERIHIVRATTAESPNEGITSGSLSIQDSGSAIRTACADMRAILLAIAARRLEASVDDLRVSDGRIGVVGTDLATSYWDCIESSIYERDISLDARPKAPEHYRVVGRTWPRLDLPKKFAGAPSFLSDLVLPDMLFGRVVRPARPGARLASFDVAAPRQLPGVQVIVDGSFIGVVAEREELAVRARERLRDTCRWEGGDEIPPPERLFEFLAAHALPAEVVDERIDAAAVARATRTLHATYTRPYLAHASIGPSSAAAQWSAGRLTVWSHSQGIFNLRRDLALALRMPEHDVTVHHMEGAGCYGHNGSDDAAMDAALLARQTAGRPVLLQWMRDDEFGWEPLGPAMQMTLAASLDNDGRIVSFRHETLSNGHTGRPGRHELPNLLASWYLAQPFARPAAINPPLATGGGAERNAVPGYAFPDQRISVRLVETAPLRVSSLRSLGVHGNIFALESFVDEVAAAAGADPIEFRLRHLTDPRARDVLKTAVERSSWRAFKRTEGCGHGIAWARYKNTGAYCAAVVEIDATAVPRVTRIVLAVDAGLVINPDGLINQIEGGALQAASWTLKEAVRFDANGVTSRAWEAYPIMTFSEAPAIEVVLIDRPEERALGGGEPAQGPVAAAIANAVYDALGVRVRAMPITREAIIAAVG